MATRMFKSSGRRGETLPSNARRGGGYRSMVGRAAPWGARRHPYGNQAAGFGSTHRAGLGVEMSLAEYTALQKQLWEQQQAGLAPPPDEGTDWAGIINATAGTLEKLWGSYTQYEQQQHLQELNILRANQGLPPTTGRVVSSGGGGTGTTGGKKGDNTMTILMIGGALLAVMALK